MDDKREGFRRRQNFKRLLAEHKKNNMDHIIPGFRPHDDRTESYIIQINHLNDLKLPPKIDIGGKDVKAEIHFSFFYRGDQAENKFFFGRTAKSAPIPLNKRGGETLGAKDVENNLWFHTSLLTTPAERKGDILLVGEVVILVHEPSTGPSKCNSVCKHMLSGGYFSVSLFSKSSDRQVFDLIQGSPRYLTADIDKSEKKVGTANAVLTIRPYPAF